MRGRWWRMALALSCALLCCAVLTPARAQWVALQSPGTEAAAFSPAGRPGLLALAATARILVASEEEPNALRVVHPDTGRSLGYMGLSSRVVALAVNATGQRAYLLTNDEWLLVVDLSQPARPALAATYRLDGDPEALALNPSGGELLVAERERRQILALDPATGKLLRSKSFDTAPVKLSYGAGGQRLLVGADQGKLYTLDAHTWAAVSTVVLGDEIRDLIYWEAGDRAVVVHKRQDGASLVDVVGGQVSRFVPLDGDPDRLSLDAGLERAYITTRDDFSVNRLDVRAARLDGRYVLPGRAGGIAFDASNNHVLVSQPSDRTLLRLDPEQAPLIAVLQLAKRLKDIVVNNATDEAVAVADRTNELTRIRLSDRSTQTLSLPGRPLRVALDTAANVALVGMADQTLRAVALSGTSPVLLTASAQLAGRPEALAADPTRHLAVVLTDARDRVQLIDTQSMTLRATLRPSDDYDALAVHSGRGLAYLVSEERGLALLSLDARSIVQTIQLPFRATAVAVDETLDLAVFGSNDAKVYVLDLTRLTSQTTRLSDSDFIGFALPRHPGNLGLQPDTSLVVTTSEASDAVSLLDLAAGIATPGYTSLPRPSHLAVAARGNQALVLSAERDEVAFIALPNPPPQLDAITPDHALLNSAALTLKLTGKHFVGASRAWFGATALATTYVSAKELSATLPASLLTVSGSFPVTVRNPAPAGGNSQPLAFRVLAPAPLLQQLVPSSLPADSQAHPLALKGQYFQSGAKVSVSGQWLSAAFVSAGELSVQLPATVFAAAADVPLFVLNPDGQTSNLMTLSVVPASPAIDSISPVSGPIGTLVTLTGRNFDPAPGNNQVSFSGAAAATVLTASGTQMTLRVPPLSETGPITLTTSRGSTQSPTFTVVRDQDAQLIPSPATVTLLQGASTTVGLSLSSTGTNAFTGLASLSAAALPAGVSAKFTPATLSAYQNGTLTLSADAQATPGTYTLTLNAGLTEAGQTRTKRANVNVTVAAANGVTGVAGRFVDPQGRGIAGIIVRADTGNNVQPQTTTDAAGNFLLTGLPAATITLRMDATPANPLYPIWPFSVTLVSNRVMVIPDWTINPPPTDDKFTPISNASADQQITDPRYPGLAITLPAGVTITGWDGVKKTRIAVQRIDADKLPVSAPPFPMKEAYQLYFGTPMGGIPSAPIPVTLPNVAQLEPGDQTNIWYFDGSPMGGSGQWKIAGTGTVSADGLSIVSDPGSGIPRFCGVCGLMSASCPPPPNPPQSPPTCPKPKAGNPVDLYTGQEQPSTSGLRCAGLTPIDTGLSYNPVDAFNNRAGTVGSFGYGWISDYDIAFLPFQGPQKRLILPGGQFVNFLDDGSGNYTNVADPRFDGAVIRATDVQAGLWELRLKDGRRWRFAPFAGIPGRIRGGPPTFVVEMADTNGNVLPITRQSNGRITRVGGSARGVSMSYGANGFVSRMTDSAGRTMQFTYTADDRLQTVTDAEGKVTQYSYVGDDEIAPDPACAAQQPTMGQRLKTIQYPGRPQPSQNFYGAGRRVLRQVGYDGREFRFAYKLTGACVTNVSNPGVVCTGASCPTVDSWDNFQAGWRIHGGQVVGVTVNQPDGASYSIAFNARGMPVTRTDTQGQTTQSTYDSAQRLTEEVDSLGRRWRYTYDTRGNRVQTVDALGRIVDASYDANWNRPTTVTRYLDQSAPLDQKIPVSWQYAYDPQAGTLTRRTDPLNQTTQYGYSAKGQLSSVTSALGQVSSLAYNDQGDLVAAANPVGDTSVLGTDAVGRTVQATDALGFTTYIQYNGMDDLTVSTDRLGQVTQLQYDNAGRLSAVTDPLNHAVASYQYDALDRLSTRTDALNRSQSYTYDSSNRPTQLTDRNGQVTRFSYDSESRLTRVDYADGRVHTRAYDAAGRLNEITEGASRHSFAYDAANRLLRVSESGPAGSSDLSYAYDNLDRRTSRMLSFNGQLIEQVGYSYDATGRLTALSYRSPAMGIGNAVTTTYQWDAANRLTQKTLPDGIQVLYSYDQADRLLQILYQRTDASVIETITYAYDADGHRISKSISTPSRQETAFNAQYDATNRLTQITLAPTGANPKTYVLSYDANGNLLRKGNQSDSSDVTLYTWDASNRLIALQGPGLTASFAYDALGRRIGKTVNGVSTQYVYDAAQVIAEIANGAVSATQLSGLAIDEAIARYATQPRSTYLTDGLGSVIAQVADDQSIQSRYAYSPYGEVSSSGNDSGNPIQYTARENDGTGLYYYRARYYDPVLKRFVAEDPINLLGGLNLYAYVEGSPLTRIDPRGTHWFEVLVEIYKWVRWLPEAEKGAEKIANWDPNAEPEEPCTGTFCGGGGRGGGGGASSAWGCKAECEERKTVIFQECVKEHNYDYVETQVCMIKVRDYCQDACRDECGPTDSGGSGGDGPPAGAGPSGRGGHGGASGSW